MNEPSSETLGQMQRIAKRLQQDQRFMASVLSTYQLQEHLTDENLANSLNITQVNIARLALCKRPDTLSSAFADEVRQIANYVQIDPGVLANLVRQVDNLREFGKRPFSNNVSEANVSPSTLSQGLLAAARDRSEEEQPPDINEGDQGEKVDRDRE